MPSRTSVIVAIAVLLAFATIVSARIFIETQLNTLSLVLTADENLNLQASARWSTDVRPNGATDLTGSVTAADRTAYLDCLRRARNRVYVIEQIPSPTPTNTP